LILSDAAAWRYAKDEASANHNLVLNLSPHLQCVLHAPFDRDKQNYFDRETKSKARFNRMLWVRKSAFQMIIISMSEGRKCFSSSAILVSDLDAKTSLLQMPEHEQGSALKHPQQRSDSHVRWIG
jgi:hypothetical protein